MPSWSAIGAGALALAVILGAFGAHVLRDRLDAYAMDVFERAVFYHFLHALALLVVPLFERAGWLSQTALKRVAAALLIGIVLFSGSLYMLAITGARALGAVTPLGGLAFILAWIMLAIELLRSPRT